MNAGADTRKRILEVSLELFIEKGYDGTSLREIAERLGFTKAALYYHFSSKELILRELLEPANRLLSGLLARLDAADTVEDWADALEWVVGEVFANGALFPLIARNRHVVEGSLGANAIGSTDVESHVQLLERAEAAARAVAADIPEQVRMIAALAAVTGFDDWAPTLLQAGPPEVLAAELVAVTRRILGLKARSRRS